jgi:hypothetical protein
MRRRRLTQLAGLVALALELGPGVPHVQTLPPGAPPPGPQGQPPAGARPPGGPLPPGGAPRLRERLRALDQLPPVERRKQIDQILPETRNPPAQP